MLWTRVAMVGVHVYQITFFFASFLPPYIVFLYNDIELLLLLKIFWGCACFFSFLDRCHLTHNKAALFCEFWLKRLRVKILATTFYPEMSTPTVPQTVTGPLV